MQDGTLGIKIKEIRTKKRDDIESPSRNDWVFH